MDLILEQEIEIYIERLGINGEGVGRFEGFTVFVDGGLPRETVLAKVYEKRKNFARASVVEWLVKSPYRISPACSLFGLCGGCQLMHLAYEEQLKVKTQRVKDALERIGKIEKVEVLPCKPSILPLGYRNKIQMPVKMGVLGLYARNTHDQVEVQSCKIHCELGESVLQEIRKIVKDHPIDGLSHVLIRTAIHTQQVLVILVAPEEERASLEILAKILMERMSAIRGVVHNIHRPQDNVILGERFQTLAGEGRIEEILCGLSFTISPSSFFQVNPLQAEALYDQVRDFAAVEGEEVVLDAYCGVGTLALLLARSVQKVIGIECVSHAIEDAKANMER
ncbi:MAG: 23S rRNA (uracil(1939)-C(5))-methyltransferase RlmD, partial [Chlamydiota bacterium]